MALTDPALTVRQLAVPSSAAPRPVQEALETREARRRDYRADDQRLREAQAGIAEADRLDLLAVADARDAGRDDPPMIHRERARRAVEAAQHDLEVERVRLERAHQALEETIGAHAEAWTEAASAARARAGGKPVKALAQLRQAEQEGTELRRVGSWLQALAEGTPFDRVLRKGGAAVGADTSVVDAANQGRMLQVGELLDAVERYLANTTQEAEEQRSAERAAQEAADERAREEIREFRQLHPGVPLPNN